MGQCKFKSNHNIYHCSLEIAPNEEYCFWHLDIKRKILTLEQFNLLKEQKTKSYILFDISLSHANFQKVNLSGVFLIEVDLSNANLIDAKLTYTDMVKANLDSADLRKANLEHSRLIQANLSNANMQEANLECVNLKEANLDNVDLRKANLRKTELFKTVLTNADLRKANLEYSQLIEADLSFSNIQGANLNKTKFLNVNVTNSDFQGADLIEANLQGQNLTRTKLQDANLKKANLQDAILIQADLRRAKLDRANLRGANLEKADLTGVSLKNVVFDSKSLLDNTILIGADLYQSYVDLTTTFRDAIFFKQNDDKNEKEFNEFYADNYSNKIIIDATEIEKQNPELYFNLRKVGAIKELMSDQIIFYDAVKTEFADKSINLMSQLDTLLFKQVNSNNSIINTNFVYSEKSKARIKKELYQKSYEVYNKLYHFFSSNGDFEVAKHVHYRREEVYRKLLIERGGVQNKIKSWLFNWLILKQCAGYGDDLNRPIMNSIMEIIVFFILFWIIKGVSVTGRSVQLIDYLYLSVTSFTGLGFSNVQPDINVPIMQYLVMFEAILGVLNLALIIFIITYQVSR